ncbi:Phosphomannomutase/phosphoglucomutase [bioreactor metagenome]|uniref:Phosphomannomutase/phosphoglucomutase n=1 Tax=bioreactor metagenome TaxID=1076179 RepID=A0A644V5D6_9ZZZZ|nr:phosphomannomutase [Acidaminococcaceae bacterium]
MFSEKAFKAYDIRGIVPTEVNEEMAYRVGRVFAVMLGAKSVVIGRDIRTTGKKLTNALAEGLRHAGTNVIDIGQCGTEMIYFATAHLKTDGGIMVTASHNPANYNGMKLVRRGAKPISEDTGLKDIARMVVNGAIPDSIYPGTKVGKIETYNIMPEYIKHILTYVDTSVLKPLKIVVNPGNGGAGAVIKKMEKKLPFEFIKINEKPDGTFPNGVPNPLLPENRAVTSKVVIDKKADLGIAWDGDFDRCFFFDEKGSFIEGYYLVGLLAQVFLEKNPGEKILYDPRLTWNTEEIIEKFKGQPVRCKSGHAFIKECMRTNGVIYGGEMSAHHYFRDFSYCDSGMIPWLMVTELMSRTGKTLAQLVEARVALYPCSGEINRKVENAGEVLAKIEKKYADAKLDYLDGISVEYAKWRFNIRISNTEPVMRLNVETRGDEKLLQEKTNEVLAIMGGNEV